MKLFVVIIYGLLGSLQPNAQTATVQFEQRSIPIPVIIDSVVQRHNKKLRGYEKLGEAARDLLYWTNYSRINPRRYWDSVVLPIITVYPQLKGEYSESLRKDLFAIKTGLPLFSLDPILSNIAQSHANDITSKKAKPGHNSSDGSSFQQRFKRTGLRVCGGENISFGEITPYFAVALLYIDYGLPEFGHRKALLNASFTRIGIGAASFSADNYFYVQDFACP